MSVAKTLLAIRDEIEALSPPDRLRLAADLLDQSALAGGRVEVTSIALSIVQRVSHDLARAIAQHNLSGSG